MTFSVLANNRDFNESNSYTVIRIVKAIIWLKFYFYQLNFPSASF